MNTSPPPSQQLPDDPRRPRSNLCRHARRSMGDCRGRPGLIRRRHMCSPLSRAAARKACASEKSPLSSGNATDGDGFITALVRKGLLTKTTDTEDTRAVTVGVTQAGREIVRGVGLVITSTERALETLSAREQTELLQLVIKTIRALQITGAIAPQRMCVTSSISVPTRTRIRARHIIAPMLTRPWS